MNPEERALAEAAANLTVEDFEWLDGHGVIADPPTGPDCVSVTHAASQEAVPEEKPPEKKRRTRRTRNRPWPETGTILEAHYFGTHYEAEVIEAPKYRSGKALKILTGAAAGTVHHSLSGAMLKATQAQRHQQSLDRRGVANGWAFWKLSKGGADGQKA